MRSLRSGFELAFAWLLVIGWVAGGCTLSPIVGASCRRDFVECDNRCVLLSSDHDACGACGTICGAAEVCSSGLCMSVNADGGGDGSIDGSDSSVGLDGALDSAVVDAEVDSSTLAMDGSADSGIIDARVVDGSESDSGAAGDAGIVTDSGGPDSGELDASMIDSGVPDSGLMDSGPPDTGVDAGPLCDLGQLECSGVCVDAIDDPQNCGDCGVVCSLGEVCSLGVCASICQSELNFCANRCVDSSTDPDNCGGCNMRCVSGICIDGECSEPVAGHVVVLGHDYTVRRTGMNRLAGNAVFLARGNPTVHAVGWGGAATDAHVITINAAIAQVETETGRQLIVQYATDAARVPLMLASADALIIYPQANSTNGTLRDLGFQWALTLQRFVARGGVIVLFESPTMQNEGTFQILETAGLFACSGRSDTTGIIRVVGASDAVAVRLPLTYSSELNTVSFASTEGVVVTEDPNGAPVVIHRTILPAP